jgi:hypothetical protein
MVPRGLCAAGLLAAVTLAGAGMAAAQSNHTGVTSAWCSQQRGQFQAMSSLGARVETGNCFIPATIPPNAAQRRGTGTAAPNMPVMVPPPMIWGPVEGTRHYEGAGAAAQRQGEVASRLFDPPAAPIPPSSSVPWADAPAGATFGRGTMRPMPERLPARFARMGPDNARMSTLALAAVYNDLLSKEVAGVVPPGSASRAFNNLLQRSGWSEGGRGTHYIGSAGGNVHDLNDPRENQQFMQRRSQPGAAVFDMRDAEANRRRNEWLRQYNYQVDTTGLDRDPQSPYWQQRRADDEMMFRAAGGSRPSQGDFMILGDPATDAETQRIFRQNFGDAAADRIYPRGSTSAR